MNENTPEITNQQKTPHTKLSIPIQIAAFIFLVGGLLCLFGYFIQFTVAIFAPGNGLINFILLSFFSLVDGIIRFTVGWFMVKRKRWSYLLGIAYITFFLALHLFIFISAGAISYQLGLSALILTLLILGKDDFKEK